MFTQFPAYYCCRNNLEFLYNSIVYPIHTIYYSVIQYCTDHPTHTHTHARNTLEIDPQYKYVYSAKVLYIAGLYYTYYKHTHTHTIVINMF